jgi:hypothetical protein
MQEWETTAWGRFWLRVEDRKKILKTEKGLEKQLWHRVNGYGQRRVKNSI